MMNPDIQMIWLIIMLTLFVIELATLGLTTIWFAIGALCAMIAAVAGAPFSIQLILFFAVSVVMLLVTRPWAIRYLNSRTTKTNAEALIGRVVRVTEDINNLRDEGHVIVDGMEWTARSSDSTITFRKDDFVVIDRIEGVKMIVSRTSGEEDKTLS